MAEYQCLCAEGHPEACPCNALPGRPTPFEIIDALNEAITRNRAETAAWREIAERHASDVTLLREEIRKLRARLGCS